MTDPPNMTKQDVLLARLHGLKSEHRDLDDAIRVLEEKAGTDILTLRRMKKRKLSLKDQIFRLEDVITPDIIA